MTRARALQGARVGFVALTLGFAWWGFRGRWDEVGAALAATDPPRIAFAVLCAAVGLVLTGALWRSLLAALGSSVAAGPAAGVFFAGQLGKYLPGSVWSFAAQAQLGRRYDVPARTSLAASSLFLLVHTASGLLLGGLLALAIDPDLALGGAPDEWSRGRWLLVALAGAAALSPPLLRVTGDRLAGTTGRTCLRAGDVAPALALMCATWGCYGISAWVLVPGGVGADALPTVVAAFALAHAAGVLLVLAPAGLGAREAVLVVLLAPLVGLGGAVAVALLARIVHAVADFAVAGAATVLARRVRVREAVGVRDA